MGNFHARRGFVAAVAVPLSGADVVATPPELGLELRPEVGPEVALASCQHREALLQTPEGARVPASLHDLFAHGVEPFVAIAKRHTVADEAFFSAQEGLHLFGDPSACFGSLVLVV